MKKLLFLMLLAFCIQCKQESSVVTINVSPYYDAKPGSESVPIGFKRNELIVIMPKSADSLLVKQDLEKSGLKPIHFCPYNASIQLYKGRFSNSDSILLPPPPPPPPKKGVYINNYIVSDNDPINAMSLYEGISSIYYALSKGAKVINIGWRVPSSGQPQVEENIHLAFQHVLADVARQNALLIAQMGNDGLKFGTAKADAARVKSYPAAFAFDSLYGSNVLSVGAWDTKSNSIAQFSNEDNYADIYAPSVDVANSYIINSQYSKGISAESSTAYAAQYVARLAASLQGLSSCISPKELKGFIKSNCQSISMDKASQPILLLNALSVLDKKTELKKCQ